MAMELQSIIQELRQPPRDIHDIPRRADLCRLALRLLPREGNERLWAALQLELGNSLKESPAGKRVDNIEQAIDAYKQALSVLTPSAMPAQWAATMNNLALAYCTRILGNKAENLEQAIAAYEQALIVRTQSAMPAEWAQTLNNLAIAYRNRIRGDKAENLEQAIAAYEQVLTVRTQSAMPVEWAQTQNNLANAYAERIVGNRANNLEQAIHHFNQALLVRTRNDFPVDWATTQNNLANAYAERIVGSRADNLEQSIYHYNQALLVRTQSAMPVEWAQTQNNLATIYAERIAGTRVENLKQAIDHFNQALRVYDHDNFPIDWALTQNNLALALSYLSADNLEQAIYHYNQALRVYNHDNFPVDWALTQNNLALAYADRIEGNRADNLEQSIYHYNQALLVRTQSVMPVEWAQTQNNLANAFSYRIKGKRTDNLKQAIDLYNQALLKRTRNDFPAEYAQTSNNLGTLFFGERIWEDARKAYFCVIDVGRTLLSLTATDAGRQHEVTNSALAYMRVAYCELRLGQPGAALERLEAGKTRLIAESFALDDSNLLLLSDALRANFQSARASIRALEAEYRLPSDSPNRRDNEELRPALRTSRDELQQIVEGIRVEHPDFMPEGLTLPEILGLIPTDGALVAPLFTSQGSAVFVVPYGTKDVAAEHVIMLDDFTTEDAGMLMFGTDDDPGWLPAYYAERGTKALLDTLDTITRRLWDKLVGAIDARLQTLGVKRVLFMPQGGLGLLPVHAAWREVEGKRRYFMDDYTITYAPSAYALQAASKRAAHQTGKNALIAGVSHYPEPLSDLPNTASEARAIADLFGVSPLLDGQVVAAAVNALSRSANYLHLACHGSFAWGGDTYQAGLFLHNGEMLTMGEIMGRLDLKQARLVTLSACETGITDIRNAPDEFLGLPAAFMQAGASAVVSSLWSVADECTALLMEKMYQLMLDEANPVEPALALREAQFWLRSNPAYAHPFYWAAFKIDGV